MTTGTHSDSMKNLLAMGKLAAMVKSLAAPALDNNPVGIIRKVLANNNGAISIASLATELNRQMGIPEGLDTQGACIRTIMTLAEDPSSFYKVEGDTVKYVIDSTCEKMWRTAASFEAFAQFADKNNGFPHHMVDRAVNDLKVFMRSNTHAIDFITKVTGDIPKPVATLAFSISVAALMPAPNDGSLPGWLQSRAEKMVTFADMDLVERIMAGMINMNAFFFDGLSKKQLRIADGLEHTQIDVSEFYHRLPLLVEKIRAMLVVKESPKPSPAPAPEQVQQTNSVLKDAVDHSQSLAINMVHTDDIITDEQRHHVRNEMMGAYREMITDLSTYVSSYRDEDGPSAIEHIRKVCKLALELDLDRIEDDDALESFMLFGNPGCINLDLKDAMVLAHHLRLAVRMAYIFN